MFHLSLLWGPRNKSASSFFATMRPPINAFGRSPCHSVKLVLSYSGSRLLSFASESDLWLDRVTIRRMDSVRGDLFLS